MRYAVLCPGRCQGARTESLWMVISSPVLLWMVTNPPRPSIQVAMATVDSGTWVSRCIPRSAEVKLSFLYINFNMDPHLSWERLPTDEAHEAILAWWLMEVFWVLGNHSRWEAGELGSKNQDCGKLRQSQNAPHICVLLGQGQKDCTSSQRRRSGKI